MLDQQDDRSTPLEVSTVSSSTEYPHAGLLFYGMVAFTWAAALLSSALLVLREPPVLALSCLAGALLLAAAGFGATRLMAAAGSGRRWGQWTQPALAISDGLCIGLIIFIGERAPTAPASGTLLATGGGMLVSAFPVLVLERFCAGISETVLSGATGLTALLRAVLFVQTGLGLGLLLEGIGAAGATLLVPICTALVLVLAAEFVLRGVAALFLPTLLSSPAAFSVIATYIRLRPPSLSSINRTIAQHSGIDLSQSWALRFVGRALLPTSLLLGLLAWGLTGLIALPLDQRAVFEQFGRPVAVLGPGLHVLPPWPIGVIRRVERGVLHELALTGPIGSGDTGATRPDAEDLPPAAADRLWDQSHPAETTYLIASAATSGQGFQRIDVDLRLITRIGLSDAAALQATYSVADPDALVRAAAARILETYFASRTLAGVLGEDRQTFTDTVRAALQHALDQLSSGVEIVAVVVEAIHPPPAAASAWHNVESAAIQAQAAIAEENGEAAKATAAARATATNEAYAAAASAAEIVAKATADHMLFSADHTANAAEPEAFQLERWLTRLRATLPRAQLLILDHRLTGIEAPTLDLRDISPAVRTPP